MTRQDGTPVGMYLSVPESCWEFTARWSRTASPVLDLADAFHDIFDAVTSTFRFV
ncbi:hypothetical protein [Streptomyces massasporeus]|uniref:hypothetical protein n=1 Tax=Streptomyces massasporeus TaxID=67324 RepID=UPI0033DCF983